MKWNWFLHHFRARSFAHSERDWKTLITPKKFVHFYGFFFFHYPIVCVFVGLFDSYHHLGSSCVSYTSANGIQNTSKASIRKFHRSQVYMIILFSSCLVILIYYRMPCIYTYINIWKKINPSSDRIPSYAHRAWQIMKNESFELLHKCQISVQCTVSRNPKYRLACRFVINEHTRS